MTFMSIVVPPMLAFNKYLPTGNDIPTEKHILKVNSINTRKRYEICSELTIKRPKRHQWRCSGVFYSNVSRDFLGRPISAGGLERRGEGAVLPRYGSRAKPWWGPGSKAPRSSNDLVLWNHLLLIKIYPPHPVMKLIQHIFFKNIP